MNWLIRLTSDRERQVLFELTLSEGFRKLLRKRTRTFPGKLHLLTVPYVA